MDDEGKQKVRIFTRQFEIVGDLNIYSKTTPFRGFGMVWQGFELFNEDEGSQKQIFLCGIPFYGTTGIIFYMVRDHQFERRSQPRWELLQSVSV